MWRQIWNDRVEAIWQIEAQTHHILKNQFVELAHGNLRGFTSIWLYCSTMRDSSRNGKFTRKKGVFWSNAKWGNPVSAWLHVDIVSQHFIPSTFKKVISPPLSHTTRHRMYMYTLHIHKYVYMCNSFYLETTYLSHHAVYVCVSHYFHWNLWKCIHLQLQEKAQTWI